MRGSRARRLLLLVLLLTSSLVYWAQEIGPFAPPPIVLPDPRDLPRTIKVQQDVEHRLLVHFLRTLHMGL